ncbi:MAG: dTDP-4-amino-4,6-dideoxy-D-galactose acyltransferase [Arsenophonus sp.]
MFFHANIEILTWESDFFNRKTAKLNFLPNAPTISLSQLDEYDIIKAKVTTGNTKLIDAMTTIGFFLIEGEIDFCLNVAGRVKNKSLELSVADEKDIEELKSIAATAFLHSRFRSPWYRLEDNIRFYSFWIEKAVKGTFDDICLLLKGVQGDIHGFVTIKKLSSKKEARIGLLATAAPYQRKGIGKQLITISRQWSEQKGVDRLRIATQISNISAIRLYSKMGAQIERTDYWLYRGRHDPIQ